MARKADRMAKAQRSLPLYALCAALGLAVPSAGLALAGDFAPASTRVSLDALGLGMFTPASVDPDLAARVADKARKRGIQFTPASTPPRSGARTVDLSASVRSLPMPDLAQFKSSAPKSGEQPSRLQPRIELEDREIAGRSPNTLDSVAQQTVGVGGSYRLSPNMNVMAGVRYSQERERLDPLTNSVKDSQAVYVGTQIKF